MDNYKKAYAKNALYQIAYILFTGSIMQGFLLNSGVSSADIYSYESVVTTISFIVLVATVFFADRIKEIKKVEEQQVIQIQMGMIKYQLFQKNYLLL